MFRYNYVSKLTAVAIVAAPAVAEAKVVRVSGKPVQVIADFYSNGYTSAAWDVDGDGRADGTVFADVFALAFKETDGSNLSFFDKTFRNPPNDITMPVFATSDLVGPDVPASDLADHGLFAFANPGSTGNGVITTSARLLGDLTFGHNIIGFKLIVDGALHYGYAEMELAKLSEGGNPTGLGLKIRRWAYEDEPQTAIHVEPIPAPPAAVGALTLLGLGAAGMRAWRRRSESPSL